MGSQHVLISCTDPFDKHGNYAKHGEQALDLIFHRFDRPEITFLQPDALYQTTNTVRKENLASHARKHRGKYQMIILLGCTAPTMMFPRGESDVLAVSNALAPDGIVAVFFNYRYVEQPSYRYQFIYWSNYIRTSTLRGKLHPLTIKEYSDTVALFDRYFEPGMYHGYRVYVKRS